MQTVGPPKAVERYCLRERQDVDDLAAATLTKLHGAINEREQRVVACATDVLAGVHLGAALAHDDAARGDLGAVESLDAEALRI